MISSSLLTISCILAVHTGTSLGSVAIGAGTRNPGACTMRNWSKFLIKGICLSVIFYFLLASFLFNKICVSTDLLDKCENDILIYLRSRHIATCIQCGGKSRGLLFSVLKVLLLSSAQAPAICLKPLIYLMEPWVIGQDN